jgi:hypothetical protein
MYHAVAEGSDGATDPKVSGPILLNLFEPPISVVLWWPKACGATVPETAIHKDGDLFLAKNQIRRTRQTSNVASKTDSLTAQQCADSAFNACSLCAHLAHMVRDGR